MGVLPSASLSGALVVAAALAQVPTAPERAEEPAPRPTKADHAEFHFTRAVYSGTLGYFGQSWSTDYPKADRQLMAGVRRLLTHPHASGREDPGRLEDPRPRPVR